MPRPTSWKAYLTKSKGHKKIKLDAFSRFQARYFLATEINPIKISGMRESTQDAYFAALRVTLAYTALEALEIAIGSKGQTKILDDELLQIFWNPKNDNFVSEVVEAFDHKSKEFKEIKLFQNGELENMRALAYGIRNLMAHGTLTANRLGLAESKRRRKAVHNLANLILSTVDNRFTEYVRKIK